MSTIAIYKKVYRLESFGFLAAESRLSNHVQENAPFGIGSRRRIGYIHGILRTSSCDCQLEAIQAHAQCKQERDEAQRTLEAVRAREEAASQKSSSRESQKNKLLAQLERVRRVTTDCEIQLKDIDQQTKEAREMAHNYEKDVNRRMSSNSNSGRGLPPSYEAAPPSVTPNTMPSGHGPPQNPYVAAQNASSRIRAPPRTS